MANGCIPKPTFWTFAFYKRLQESNGKCVYKDDNIVILQKDDGSYLGVAWNHRPEGDGALQLELSLPDEVGSYTLLQKTVDENTCNPLKVWHDLGEPANPDASQIKLLRESAVPLVTSGQLTGQEGRLELQLELNPYAVVWFSLSERKETSDRGYDYQRVIGR